MPSALACVTPQPALLVLTTLQLQRLPPPRPLQAVTPLACSRLASPLCQRLSCTAVLFKVLCRVRLKRLALFFVFVFKYIIWVKSIINLLQCSTT